MFIKSKCTRISEMYKTRHILFKSRIYFTANKRYVHETTLTLNVGGLTDVCHISLRISPHVLTFSSLD